MATFSSTLAPAPMAVPQAQSASSGGGGGNILGALLGLAVSIAVPFVSPAIAGAIFGPSVMAAWGGFGGVLATAGTGAVLGALGAGVTGGNPVQGALLGGLGAGAVQGLGVLSGGAGVLGGLSGAPAAISAPAVAAAPGAGLAGSLYGGAELAGTGTSVGALGASAAGGTGGGLSLFGMQLPWDKLGNALASSAPQLLGAAASELIPPSADSQAYQQAAQDQLAQQTGLYNQAVRSAQNIDPNYFGQTAANGAKQQAAMALAEGNRDAYAQGGNNPQRIAANNRAAAIAGVNAQGAAYNNAYINALGAQQSAYNVASGLRPNLSDYASGIATYGTEADKEKMAKYLSSILTPFSTAFAKSNTAAQSGTG